MDRRAATYVVIIVLGAIAAILGVAISLKLLIGFGAATALAGIYAAIRKLDPLAPAQSPGVRGSGMDMLVVALLYGVSLAFTFLV